MNENLSPVIKESFGQYSGAVLQSRALVDARDCMKPSARQIFYCMYTDKFTHSKPFRKTLKAIGSAMRVYIHGDASCEGVIMRAGQPFAMRYPLIEVEGSYGTLVETGNWAAPRYTSARLSKLAEYLFADIDKDTIDDWRDNYDDTEKYPGVLPTKGYYNICNGTFGIGIGMGSSVPQFNIKDVNAALIKLLQNPNISDDELICIPDFATGGYLLNESEVRTSLKAGKGKACQLRAKITYDPKEHCLIATEIPYGVYTNTICGELEEMLNGEVTDNPGIERFNDLTGETPLIKIYLTKRGNPTKVMDWLYKNTSLQYWYAINLTMLDNGKYPRVFTWKEALSAHIEQEKIVYRKGFEYDLAKAKYRKHIVDGLLIAIANIDEVVATIKNASSTADASTKLQEKFLLDSAQTKAILDMKLSRLAHLEVEKLEQEKQELINIINELEHILSDEQLFNSKLITGWQEVAKSFGDGRRTELITETAIAVTETTTATPAVKVVNVITDSGEIIQFGVDEKIPAKKLYVGAWVSDNNQTVKLISEDGKIYSYTPGDNIPAQKYVGRFTLDKQYYVTVSYNGKVKKTPMSEILKSRDGTAIVKVKENDRIVFADAANDEDYLLLLGTKDNVVKFKVSSITSTGKLTIGSNGIDDNCVTATIAAEDDLVFCRANNCGKYTPCSDFTLNARGGVGQTVAANTTEIRTFREPFYIFTGTKLILCNKNSFAVKGKQAIGAKI